MFREKLVILYLFSKNNINKYIYNIYKMVFEVIVDEDGVSSFTLAEYPNTKLLNKIYRHEDIWEPQRPEYRVYCHLVKNGFINIKYVKTKKYGRYFIEDSKKRSCCAMWKKVRATLFAETEYDIDAIACHPAILFNLVKDEGRFEYLQLFINNKDEIFKSCSINDKCIDLYNKKNKDILTKKDLLKLLCTRILYGGCEQAWANEYGLKRNDYELSVEYQLLIKDFEKACKILFVSDKFERMIDNIKEQIMESFIKEHDEKELERCAKDKRLKPKPFDKKGFPIKPRQIVSILLQEYECRAIMEVFEFLKEKDITPTSYCYDGFQVKKTDFDISLIDEINIYMKDNNHGLTFIIKEFVKPFTKEELLVIEEPPDYFCRNEWSQLITYGQKKDYFEKYHKMIGSMDGLSILDCDGNLRRVKNLPMIYGHIYHNFINDYLNKDTTIPTWDNWGIYPNNKLKPKNIYNIWRGFEIEKKEYESIVPDGNISNILYHFKVVANFDEKLYEYLLNYYAHIIQKPEKKTNVCLLIQGKQGTGKTTIAELLMKNLLGSNLVFDTCDIDKICGRFNSLIQGKIYGVLNEATGKDTFGIVDKIKDSITREHVMIELKGIDPIQIKDFVNYVYTTNNTNPVKIDSDDRRFQIMECSDIHKNDTKYFERLRTDMFDKKILKTFYNFLKTRDISNFDVVNDRVMNEATEDIYELNEDPMIGFINDWFSTSFYKRTYRMDEIYSEYKIYMSENKYNYVNNKMFGKLMKKFCNKKYIIKRDDKGSFIELNNDVDIKTSIDYD